MIAIRKRPRIGAIGIFDPDFYELLETLWPAVHSATSTIELTNSVNPGELDLVLFGPGVNDYRRWTGDTNAVYFEPVEGIIQVQESKHITYGETLTANNISVGNGINLALHRQLKRSYCTLQKSKWKVLKQHKCRTIPLLSTSENPDGNIVREEEPEIQIKNLLLADVDGSPLCCEFFSSTGKRVCLLQNTHGYRKELLLAILEYWHSEEPVDFGQVNLSVDSAKWMTREESRKREEIIRKQIELERLESEIAILDNELTSLRLKEPYGEKRLLYSSGDELVEAVKDVFSSFGFDVELCDETVGKDGKKEDIRLRIDGDSEWEAIVEVKGYSRSSGKTEDLIKMKRYRDLYSKEKGHFPSKLLYIINGQIEMSPHFRQAPFASNSCIAELFAADDGCVIATTDLFLAFKDLGQIGGDEIRRRIRNGIGVFRYD